MIKLSKFQTVDFNGFFKGMTRRNHLGSLFQEKPNSQNIISNTIMELMAVKTGKGMEYMLKHLKDVTLDNDQEITWKVMGSSRRNIPLVEARDENGNVVTSSTSTNVGIGTAPFYLVFDEDWFADGETLFGHLNQLYPLRILGQPREEGTRYVYKVELMGGITTGMPAKRLLAGERFSRSYAPVEDELSRKVGDVRFAGTAEMRNEWTTIRKHTKQPGSLFGRKLLCGIPVKDEYTGKSTVMATWIHYIDWQFELEFKEEKNTAIVFGTSNRNPNGEYMNIGKSGSVIKTGAGMYEQMEVANTFYYNNFSLKLIEEALYEISAAKLDYGDRTFVIRTGERGAMLLHKAINDTISGWTNLNFDGTNVGVIKKVSSPMHSNALAAGYQFTEYLAPMGVRVKIETDPFYDDPVMNKIDHPDGGVAMSYRMDIFYLGSQEEPNMYRCSLSNFPETRSYQWGLRNPFTNQWGNDYMSYDEDSVSMHKMAKFAVVIKDPTRTMSLIPTILLEGE